MGAVWREITGFWSTIILRTTALHTHFLVTSNTMPDKSSLNATNHHSASCCLFSSGGGHSNIQFSWETRSRICIGVARGLAFLHEEVRPRIVHRDIKASNVLLDSHLTPKISDFGLAKLLPPNTTHVSTRVAGTIGYLAPEYAIHGQLTRRADTYSFGVLLLEIVTGRCNTNTRLPCEDQFLLERTWGLYERGEVLSIVDASLGDDFDAEEACRFIKIALVCTQDAPRLRPSMPAVVRMLRGESNVNMEITKPGLITDLMDLKVRRQRDAGEPDASPVVFTTLHGSPSSSSGNATAIMSSSTAAELA
ncbi:unnamed protein product [Musa banksii]